jgi:hypothetical protein
MPGQSIIIVDPPFDPLGERTVGRFMRLAGTVVQAGGHTGGFVSSLRIQFGDGGPTVNADGPDLGSLNLRWQGLVPNNIRPGQPFHIIVYTKGKVWNEQSSRFDDVDNGDGGTVIDVVLENIVPTLTVNAFQSFITVPHVPYAFTISGKVSEGNGSESPPYDVPQVECQMGDGPWTNSSISRDANQRTLAQWSATLLLQLGDYHINVQASDAFGSVAPTPPFTQLIQVRPL